MNEWGVSENCKVMEDFKLGFKTVGLNGMSKLIYRVEGGC